MKRRDALKKLGLAAGFAITAPSIFSMLQSCTADVKTWVPQFLTTDEQTVLTNLVDIILPKTATTPSATEVKVPQFIDRYIYEVIETKDQEITRAAFDKIMQLLKSSGTESIDDVTTAQYTALLDKYLLITGDIDEERKANPEAEIMTTSEFLGQLKWMTISAFRNSEQVGENILVYEPVPAEYYCGDIQELTGGKAYSL
ncbi:gluconate 2-dehydrogenase subunit 3 family protein [Polaribacter sp. HL-MS24]|uniref:gluconate 2-dehydrogenase subunit 3 family protein n=1 Tax=Polaribacter sp. HL-MS24 TaxID=3077735 RepID=UPI0029352EF1|nr:gluconate 2-dehydrogenase subunit 3 family protein [Polaribacter sp. HL-MS24]WOC40553.1 gluconate 2-dehydrogenase subunit 3 family protein [Polaribacter sp. HL-MS24]